MKPMCANEDCERHSIDMEALCGEAAETRGFAVFRDRRGATTKVDRFRFRCGDQVIWLCQECAERASRGESLRIGVGLPAPARM